MDLPPIASLADVPENLEPSPLRPLTALVARIIEVVPDALHHVSSCSPRSARGWRIVCVGLSALATGLAVTLADRAHAGNVPNWRLELSVARWVAPSSYAAAVVMQQSGPKVPVGTPVTLVLDRRTSCSAAVSGGRSTRIACAALRARVATRPSLLVTVGGQFETGHLGAIGFRARSVLVQR